MALVRTTDGVDVEWPWADIGTISLSSKRLQALRSRSAIVRILAHKDLFDFQISRLYPARFRRDRALRMRSIAKKIAQHNMADLCAGIGETRLYAIFSAGNDPERFRQRIGHTGYNEERYKEDIEAMKEFTHAD